MIVEMVYFCSCQMCFKFQLFFHQRLPFIVVLCQLFHPIDIHSCAKSDATLTINKIHFSNESRGFFFKTREGGSFKAFLLLDKGLMCTPSVMTKV